MAAAPPAPSLVETQSLFHKSRELLRQLHTNCQRYCSDVSDIYDKRCDRADRGKLVLLTDRDNNRVEQIMRRDPVIVVSGMRNTGKTSLLNELLEDDKLPSKQITNTARVTKIFYSESEFIRLRGPDGQIKLRTAFSRRELEKLTSVNHETRTKEDEVHAVVEVGLNNRLLRDGLQLVDLPGLDESEILDDAVLATLDGVLQTLVYVIDGTYGVREMDLYYLGKIKAKVASLDQVIFVCNKAELDIEAMRLDITDSSDESGEEEEQHREAAARIIQRVERRLSEERFLTHTSLLHGITCRGIKRARKRGIHTADVDDFNRLRERMIRQYQTCIHTQILEAVKTIEAVQIKLFTLIHDERDIVKRMLEQAMESQGRAKTTFDRVTEASGKLAPTVQKWFQDCTDKTTIEKTCRDMSFSGGDKENCYRKLCQLIGCTFTDEVIEPVLEKLWTKVMDLINGEEITFNIDDQTKIVCFFIGSYCVDEEKEDISELALREKKNWKDKAKKLLAVFLGLTVDRDHKIRDGRLDAVWKGKTGLDILANLDVSAMTKIAVDSVQEKIKEERALFDLAHGATCALKALQDIASNEKDIRDTLLSRESNFALDSYLTIGFLTTIQDGTLPRTQEIARGTRSVIYRVDENNVGKKFNATDEELRGICIRHSYAFFGKPVPNLVQLGKPSVSLDEDWEPVFIMKRYRCRLDEALAQGLQYNPHARLQALLEVAKTVDALMSKNVVVKNVYPKFFLVEDRDDKLVIAYNLLKYHAHEMTETIAVQLGKLLALFIHGQYDDVLGPDAENEKFMDVVNTDLTLTGQVKDRAGEMLKKYVFPGENRSLTMTTFITDLETLMETARTTARIDECLTS